MAKRLKSTLKNTLDLTIYDNDERKIDATLHNTLETDIIDTMVSGIEPVIYEDLDMSAKQIVNLADPETDQEAATKKYVDDQVIAVGGAVQATLIEVETGEADVAKFVNPYTGLNGWLFWMANKVVPGLTTVATTVIGAINELRDSINIVFDNTGTDLAATNVEEAIKESKIASNITLTGLMKYNDTLGGDPGSGYFGVESLGILPYLDLNISRIGENGANISASISKLVANDTVYVRSALDKSKYFLLVVQSIVNNTTYYTIGGIVSSYSITFVADEPCGFDIVPTGKVDGDEGPAGASAYQVWLDEGNTGTEQDFLDSLVGPPGGDGLDGADAVAGKLPSSYAELGAPIGTTSGTFVTTGVETTITLDEPVEIACFASFEIATLSGASSSTIEVAFEIDGTIHDAHGRYLSGSTDKGMGALVHRSGEFPAGTYTVKLMFRRVSGVATPGLNKADLLVMAMQGAKGETGLSAYEVWLGEGNTGTEQDFFDAIMGTASNGLTKVGGDIQLGGSDLDADTTLSGTGSLTVQVTGAGGSGLLYVSPADGIGFSGAIGVDEFGFYFTDLEKGIFGGNATHGGYVSLMTPGDIIFQPPLSGGLIFNGAKYAADNRSNWGTINNSNRYLPDIGWIVDYVADTSGGVLPHTYRAFSVSSNPTLATTKGVVRLNPTLAGKTVILPDLSGLTFTDGEYAPDYELFVYNANPTYSVTLAPTGSQGINGTSNSILLGPEEGILLRALDALRWHGVFTTPPDGGTGSAPSYDDEEIVALVTTANGQAATATGITGIPVGKVKLFVNGTRRICGNEVKTKDYYWSTNGGTTALALNAVVQGAIPYWNGSVAGFELATTDIITFDYNVE